MKLNDVFEFGKHKGKTLKNVLAENAYYVVWCICNIPNFTIEQPYHDRLMKEYWEREIKQAIACHDYDEDEVSYADFVNR